MIVNYVEKPEIIEGELFGDFEISGELLFNVNDLIRALIDVDVIYLHFKENVFTVERTDELINVLKDRFK